MLILSRNFKPFQYRLNLPVAVEAGAESRFDLFMPWNLQSQLHVVKDIPLPKLHDILLSLHVSLVGSTM